MNLSKKIFLTLALIPTLLTAQDLIPLIYKGYVEGTSGKGLNGIYDIRLMVLNSENEDNILWSRIFLDVDVRNGFFDIDMEDRSNTVRRLFNQGNDLIFRSVILDLSYVTQQYLSKNYQQIAIQEGVLFAENFPKETDSVQLPKLPFMPIKYICSFENITTSEDGQIQLKIINYGSKSSIIRILFYNGIADKKTYEFSLDSKTVWNETLSDINILLLKTKGFIEMLCNDNDFLVSGNYVYESGDSTTVVQLNWQKIN